MKKVIANKSLKDMPHDGKESGYHVPPPMQKCVTPCYTLLLMVHFIAKCGCLPLASHTQASLFA